MSRVLLFVQTGDGRPKCVRRFAHGCEYERIPARFASHLETFCHIKPMPYRDLRLAFEADRWWLVECENAAEGRRTIRHHAWLVGKEPERGVSGDRPTGRILASGGRS